MFEKEAEEYCTHQKLLEDVMGWFICGNSCYKKYLKNRKEIEIAE